MNRTFPILIAITMTAVADGAMVAAQQSVADASRQARAGKAVAANRGNTDSVDSQPSRVIHRAAPVYPPEAAARRIYGSVTVEAIVDKQGNVASARVVNGPKVFWDSALRAMKACKFEPAKSEVQLAETTIRLKFAFSPPQ